MRDDLEQCGMELYKRGFPWGFVTNGYALTRDRYGRLLDAGLRSLTISLDGLRASHDWLRNKAGSFERAVTAIELAAATDNIVFDVATCVNRRNFGELPKIKDLLNDRGVKNWRICLPYFQREERPRTRNCRFRTGSLWTLWTSSSTRKNRAGCGRITGAKAFSEATREWRATTISNAPQASRVGSVLIDGSISACPSLRADYIQGNIYKDDFWEVWNGRFRIMRNRSWTKTGPCASCKAYRWCLGNGLHLRNEKTGETHALSLRPPGERRKNVSKI